jgi:hypothetical protein
MGNKLNYFKIHGVQLLKSEEEELKPAPPLKGGRKAPKAIPVNLPVNSESLLKPDVTFSLEISKLDSGDEKPKKEKKQLNLF